jgi:ubiquinone/menaquinone biosynthesis C-methylase UbiE
MKAVTQDKHKEIAFFDGHAAAGAYDVFTPESNARLIETFIRLTGLKRGARVADLGCGSGVFTSLLSRNSYNSIGLDLSPRLIALGRSKYPDIELIEGDVEALPFESASFDSVLLGGVLHHFPDRSRCITEIFRVLKPRASFMALDPNRKNPFVWLYRDRSSPFYSSVGVTENERPVLAHEIAEDFRNAGFRVSTEYPTDLNYRYIASARLRWLLPAYNAIIGALFAPSFMKAFRPFILTYGEKP